MLIRNSRNISSRTAWMLGGLCISLAILSDRFLPVFGAQDFFEGMATGMSLVFGVWGMIRYRVEQRDR